MIKIIRWIAFAACLILTFASLIVGTPVGFFCFIVAAFVLATMNVLFRKLDKDLDPKYRKRATAITAAIFMLCGIMAIATYDGDSEKESENSQTAATTAVETATATTTTAAETTTECATTTVITTTTVAVVETTEAPQTETEAVAEETPAVTENNDPTVYITGSGNKYHKKIHGDWNATEIKKSEAEARGYTPCKKMLLKKRGE